MGTSIRAGDRACSVVWRCLVGGMAATGCAPQSSDGPGDRVMIETRHSHYHVHGSGIDHGHVHVDFAAGGHTHEHDGH